MFIYRKYALNCKCILCQQMFLKGTCQVLFTSLTKHTPVKYMCKDVLTGA